MRTQAPPRSPCSYGHLRTESSAHDAQILTRCGLLFCALQPIRLLAVVIAKNVVGSSWRKTLGSREWSRVPAEEKQAVRLAAMNMLLNGEARRYRVHRAWGRHNLLLTQHSV